MESDYSLAQLKMYSLNGTPKSLLLGFWYNKLFTISELFFLSFTKMLLSVNKYSSSPTLLIELHDAKKSAVNINNDIFVNNCFK